MKLRNRRSRRWRSKRAFLARIALGLVGALLVILGFSACDDGGAGGGNGGDGGTSGYLPPAPCSAASPEGLAGCLEKSRYHDDLVTLAVPRPADSAGASAAQGFCQARLASLGYQVELDAYGTGTNVLGWKQGTTRPSEIVIVSAHYDSVPGCPGADDDGSGLAGVLEAARALAMGSFERTLLVACWDEEELGLLGSKAFADRAATQALDVRGMISAEMIGYADHTPNSQRLPAGFEVLFPNPSFTLAENEYRGDFITVVASSNAADLATGIETAGGAIELPVIRLDVPDGLLNSDVVADLRRSDHAPFWAHGYPAIMLTDTANFRNAAYHCQQGQDTVDRLDDEFTLAVLRATVQAVATTLDAP